MYPAFHTATAENRQVNPDPKFKESQYLAVTQLPSSSFVLGGKHFHEHYNKSNQIDTMWSLRYLSCLAISSNAHESSGFTTSRHLMSEFKDVTCLADFIERKTNILSIDE